MAACMNKEVAGDGGTASQKVACAAESAASPEASPPPSFAAYVADTHFTADLCIALAAPLVMLGSIARSLDPRVGGGQAAGPGAFEARDDFPFGASAAVQVLHVARHLVRYALARPARNGDWAGLLLNVMNVVYPCMLLLVAVSSRSGPVWGWWRRHRLTFVTTTVVLVRCVLLLCTFLLLPPAAWPTHTWAGYVVSASSRPLANALALSVYDQFAKVLLPGAKLHALAQTAAVFLLAYLVAPTVVTMQRQQLQLPRGSGYEVTGTNAPIPLQCGLRPEHSALLPCRPLALQVLLGLAMVAWPVWLSWAVERRLRRQHAELCRDWGRRQQMRERQQQQAPAVQHTVGGQQQGILRSISALAAAPLSLLRRCSWHGDAVRPDEAQGGPGRAPGGAPPAPVPAAIGDGGAGPGVSCPGKQASRRCKPQGAATAAPSARYRSARTSLVVSLKVLEHPGSFEEYGNRLVSILHDAVREHNAVAAAAAAAEPAGPAPSAPSGLDNPAAATMRLPTTEAAAPAAAAAAPILHTAVIRGCVQAVLWGWVPEGGMEEGVSDAAAAQRLLQRLAGRLGGPELAGDGTGGVRGVSVQVGQAVAMMQGVGGLAHVGEDRQGDQEEVQPVRAGAAVVQWPSSSSCSGTVRLLRMDPPAASLPAAAASPGSLTVRLLLHSPSPQPTRVLVLAERQGAGGAVPPRAVLLREVAVALEGGVQEVEVELGPGEVAGAGEEAEITSGATALRVMLAGPVHVSQGAESGQQQGPSPPPLVHWVAPPLLLLPEEAAGELCGLWEQMKREQEEEEREQQQQQQGQDQEPPGQTVPDGLLPHAASPTAPAAAVAGVEQEASLWWSHMAPLMGDLAYALSAWHGQDQESEDVTCQLLDFLCSNGLHRTAALLQQTASCNGPGTAGVVPSSTYSVPTLDASATAGAAAAPAAAALAAAATPAAAAPAAAAGLPEPTALRALQLELGLRRWPPGQEAAYRAYVRQRASPPLLTLVDVALSVIMVVRSALGRLPAGALVTALLSTWVGVAEVTVWAWAPSGTRRGGGRDGGGGGGGFWRRLREPSPQDVVLWHCGSHMLTKLLCALGVSAPPGIEAYVCGPGALVYEGLLMPVCKAMPFRVALPLSFIRTVLNAGMIYTVGRRSVLFACSWALLVSCVELTTTLAMHTWLRRGFLARRRKKLD